MSLGLLSDILTFPVTGPSRGVRFVLEQIKAQVDRERLDPAGVQRQLAVLNERLNAGEISEDEFETREAALLEELDAIEEERAAAQGGEDESDPADLEVEVSDDGRGEP